MNCTYTVTKNKTNRIVYRVAGIIFCSLAFIPIISFFKGAMGNPAFTVILSAFLGGYGIYLLRMSFRKYQEIAERKGCCDTCALLCGWSCSGDCRFCWRFFFPC